MNSSAFHKAFLAFVLVGVSLAAGCGSNPEGKYQDTEGAVTLELKDGKAGLNYGPIRIDGTYKVDGEKIIIRPTVGDTSQTMVFTINKDGSLAGPPGSDIRKLQKAK